MQPIPLMRIQTAVKPTFYERGVWTLVLNLLSSLEPQAEQGKMESHSIEHYHMGEGCRQ